MATSTGLVDGGTRARESGTRAGGGRDAASAPDADNEGTDAAPADGSTIFFAGPASSFALGSATFFADQFLFVVRDDNGLFAITSTCTHAGCDVDFVQESKSYRCSCHGSAFDPNGAVTNGPATRPLVHFAASVDESGNVLVDTARIVSPQTRLVA